MVGGTVCNIESLDPIEAQLRRRRATVSSAEATLVADQVSVKQQEISISYSCSIRPLQWRNFSWNFLLVVIVRQHFSEDSDHLDYAIDIASNS